MMTLVPFCFYLSRIVCLVWHGCGILPSTQSTAALLSFPRKDSDCFQLLMKIEFLQRVLYLKSAFRSDLGILLDALWFH